MEAAQEGGFLTTRDKAEVQEVAVRDSVQADYPLLLDAATRQAALMLLILVAVVVEPERLALTEPLPACHLVETEWPAT